MKLDTGLWSIILAVCSMLCTVAALVCLGLLVFKDSDGDAVAAPASPSEDAPVIVTVTQGAGDSGGPEPTATGDAGGSDAVEGPTYDYKFFLSSDAAVYCQVGGTISYDWVELNGRSPDIACGVHDFTGPDPHFTCSSKYHTAVYYAVGQASGGSAGQGVCSPDPPFEQGFWPTEIGPEGVQGKAPAVSAGEKAHREGYTCTGGDTITCTEDATGYGFRASVSAIELIEP